MTEIEDIRTVAVDDLTYTTAKTIKVKVFIEICKRYANNGQALDLDQVLEIVGVKTILTLRQYAVTGGYSLTTRRGTQEGDQWLIITKVVEE